MSSQKDIASLARVSQMTVSLALRDSPIISSVTKQRVRDAARKLNYHPDPLVSALMRQRKRKVRKHARAKIAFLHDNPNDLSGRVSAQYASGCFNGAREVAQRLGYVFDAVYVDRRQISGSRLSQILWTQNVQGILIAPMSIGSDLHCDWDLFSIISLDYSHAALNVHRVIDDHMAGMTELVSRIGAQGYCRPALVMRESGDDRTNHNRLGAFLAQCARKPWLATIPPLIFEEDDWSDVKFMKWIHEHQPDVIVAGDHRVVVALEKSGIDVPSELGVALYYKEAGTRRYSGLSVDATYVGEVSAKLLISMIENNQRGLPAKPTTTYVNAAQWDKGISLRDNANAGAAPCVNRSHVVR